MFLQSLTKRQFDPRTHNVPSKFGTLVPAKGKSTAIDEHSEGETLIRFRKIFDKVSEKKMYAVFSYESCKGGKSEASSMCQMEDKQLFKQCEAEARCAKDKARI